MLAYATRHNGSAYLNPVLVLRKGQSFEAELVNDLTEPTIIHWHGVDCHWRQAGHPSYAVEPGGSYDYAFSITNRAGTYWYHPHPHGLTARQSYLGLASFFLVLGEYRRIAARNRPGGAGPTLTERETEVLRHVAKGLTAKQIAAKLSVSHRTVENHVQATFRKLQLANRVELTSYAIEHGLDKEP